MFAGLVAVMIRVSVVSCYSIQSPFCLNCCVQSQFINFHLTFLLERQWTFWRDQIQAHSFNFDHELISHLEWQTDRQIALTFIPFDSDEGDQFPKDQLLIEIFPFIPSFSLFLYKPFFGSFIVHDTDQRTYNTPRTTGLFTGRRYWSSISESVWRGKDRIFQVRQVHSSRDPFLSLSWSFHLLFCSFILVCLLLHSLCILDCIHPCHEEI